MNFLLEDSRGRYFEDKRRCYWCDNWIKIDEEYDYDVISCSQLRVYYCEKCLSSDMNNNND